jgi:hypothetical protein
MTFAKTPVLNNWSSRGHNPSEFFRSLSRSKEWRCNNVRFAALLPEKADAGAALLTQRLGLA